jgi:hypothetical protein
LFCATLSFPRTSDGALIPKEAIDKANAALEIIKEAGDGGKINFDATVSALCVLMRPDCRIFDNHVPLLSPQEAQMMLAKLMEVLKPSNVQNLSNECAICLESFDEGSAMALRGCSHIFCSECLEQLKEQKKCPLCRLPFQEKDKITVKECKAALKNQSQNKKKAPKAKITTWDGEEEAPKIVYVCSSPLSCQPSPPHLVVSFV